MSVALSIVHGLSKKTLRFELHVITKLLSKHHCI
jgi:hypothetical protein